MGELWIDSVAPLRTQPRITIHVKKREETGDTVSFARERLKFHPDEKQSLVLRGGRRGL